LSSNERVQSAERFFGFIVGLVVILVLVFAVLPVPVNSYVMLGIVVVWVAGMVWLYRVKSRARNVRSHSLIDTVSLIFAAVTEISSAYILYLAGYLKGSYDILAPLIKIMNIPFSTDLHAVYIGIAISSLGITTGTITIAFVMFHRGLIRGKKAQS
jgi:hypothetical protein